MSYRQLSQSNPRVSSSCRRTTDGDFGFGRCLQLVAQHCWHCQHRGIEIERSRYRGIGIAPQRQLASSGHAQALTVRSSVTSRSAAEEIDRITSGAIRRESVRATNLEIADHSVEIDGLLTAQAAAGHPRQKCWLR